MLKQHSFSIKTSGRGLIVVTEPVCRYVQESTIQRGLCHLFLHHTSASLILSENADPTVLSDLESFMSRLVPDGDPLFEHLVEGSDDMAAHIRSVLTTNFLSMPITQGQLALGPWQGIYLWEHRIKAHQRKMTVTIFGE